MRNLEVRYGPVKISKECKNNLTPISAYRWTVTTNEVLSNETEHMNCAPLRSHPGAFPMGVFMNTKKIQTMGMGDMYRLNKRYLGISFSRLFWLVLLISARQK